MFMLFAVNMSLNIFGAFEIMPRSSPQPPVVQLNVGGHLFSTFLSTLRRHPESRLAEMFSGQQAPRLRTDSAGRYFIDRDGAHFGAVLDFLRSDRVPTEHVREVGGQRTPRGPSPQTRVDPSVVYVYACVCACVRACVCVCRSSEKPSTTTSGPW